MTLIAANVSGLLEVATTLRPAGAGAAIGRVSQSLGEPGADSAMDGFRGAVSGRMAELDHLVERAAAVLAVYAANFDRAGG